MKTIVKGKNMKKNYEYDYELCYYSFMRRDFGSYDYTRHLKDELNFARWTKIKDSQTIESYKTYFESDDINYRLNIGEKFEDDVIENVEGTKDGDIIYYTSKVLRIDENIEEKNRLQDNLNKKMRDLETEISNLIEEKVNKKKWYQFWRKE